MAIETVFLKANKENCVRFYLMSSQKKTICLLFLLSLPFLNKLDGVGRNDNRPSTD